MFGGLYELVGFLIGLEDETWVQLWSGVFGAIPAAVISAAVAAAVAVTVLGRSNDHQRELASKQAEEQRFNAERTLLEQRSLLQQQLKEQRALADRQLAEQRKEASRAREQLAIAEVIIAVEDLIVIDVDFNERGELQHRSLRTALARWRAELGGTTMQHELFLWTGLFQRLTHAVRAEGPSLDPPGSQGGASSILAEAMANVTGVAVAWQLADDASREDLCNFLVSKRETAERSLGAIEGQPV